MSDFDDAISTVRKYFDAAAAKTGEAIDLSKCYIEKTQTKNKLNSLYERLGKAVYSTEIGEKNEKAVISDIIFMIKNIRAELDDINTRYQNMHSTVCPNCGKKNSPKSIFCSACGERI